MEYWTTIDEICRSLQVASKISDRSEGTKISVRGVIKKLILMDLVERKGRAKGTRYKRIRARNKLNKIRGETERIIDDGLKMDAENKIHIAKLMILENFNFETIVMYMQLSRFKSESAREISKRTDIPLASVYRRMNALDKLGMLIEGDRGLTREGKRYSTYKRRYASILIDDRGMVYFVEKRYK